MKVQELNGSFRVARSCGNSVGLVYKVQNGFAPTKFTVIKTEKPPIWIVHNETVIV